MSAAFTLVKGRACSLTLIWTKIQAANPRAKCHLLSKGHPFKSHCEGKEEEEREKELPLVHWKWKFFTKVY